MGTVIYRKTQHPNLRDALGNPIVDAQLTADSFNAFLPKTFIEDSTTPLPTIQALTGAVLETITFTLWNVTAAIRRFRQSHSPGPDDVTKNSHKFWVLNPLIDYAVAMAFVVSDHYGRSHQGQCF
ncbi:hypothetical protein SprV_0200982800 [Sparganum proliferum]